MIFIEESNYNNYSNFFPNITLLESEIDTNFHTARRCHLSEVDALGKGAIAIGCLWVESEIIGDGEEILSCDECCSSLDETPQRLVPSVGESDVGEFEIGTILNPTVGEGIVANLISPACSRNVGYLSFHGPTTSEGCALVGEVGTGFSDTTNCIVDVVAATVGECEIEGKATIFEACEQ